MKLANSWALMLDVTLDSAGLSLLIKASALICFIYQVPNDADMQKRSAHINAALSSETTLN